MPRKKSVKGRSRGVDAVNRIMLEAEKINKQIRQLEKAGLYGTYKSKELIRFARENPYVSIKKSKGSKRHRVAVSKVKMSIANARLIDKKFKEILKSKAMTPIGIEKIEKDVRKKVTETLSDEVGRKVTKKEVEMFYDIIKYQSLDIIEQIGKSEFFLLVNDMKDSGVNQETWINNLGNYVDINNENIRKQAEMLYTKYVR